MKLVKLILTLTLLITVINCSKEEDDDMLPLAALAMASSQQSTSINSSEQATVELKGTVKDSAGTALAGATLTVTTTTSSQGRASLTSSTTTETDGSFTLNIKIGKYTISVKKSDGSDVGSFSFEVKNLTEKHISITSQSGVQITITSAKATASNTDLVTATSTTTTVPSISFTSTTFSLTVGSAISGGTPSTTGTITSCSISPALPSGLSINSTTCVISGTPKQPQSETSYSITPANSAGNGTAVTIKITSGCGSGGFAANNYCWFTGAAGESCDTVCSGKSLTCEATQVNSYTGKDGTNDNCKAILDGLSIGSGTVADNVNIDAGVGCAYSNPFRFNFNKNTTTCAASYTQVANSLRAAPIASAQRACPCN